MNSTPDATQRPEVELFPEGFLAIHNGFAEHLQQGRMTPSMLAVYVILQFQVDWSTGRWNGNSHRIHGALGGQLSLSQIRRTLARLEKFGYIKRFVQPGLHGNYFVLINKYRVRLGELKGMVLNTQKSSTWEAPVYEPRSHREVTCAPDAPEMRGTCASDACHTRGTCVSDARHMRPYQEEQDGQDVPHVREGVEVNNSRATTSSTSAAAGDDDDLSENTSSPKPSATANQAPIKTALTDKEAFFVKQELAWTNERVNPGEIPLQATKAHLEESYQAYLKYGFCGVGTLLRSTLIGSADVPAQQ